jgi:2-keto-4-pentenoate hydratase/2-oxohepta-3-ene-1,7-dioic acid hydratase in catechol pathway
MKLCRYLDDDGAVRIGKITDAEVVDVSVFVEGPPSMRRLLEALSRLRGALERFEGPRRPLAGVTLLAPIDDPQKFLAIGMNYRAHAEEAAAAGIPVPKSQLWFNKQVSCINGPTGAIELPKVSDKVDYEAELAVVIGQRCHDVPAEQALSVVAGYMVSNDVSVRDWQARSPTFTLGKSFDSHGPIGPWITTADEIDDPQDLVLSLSVNGEERQRASTRDMIYDIPQQIAYLSTVMTLEPGDILATGTPAGVGIASGRFLRNGDVVEVEIAGLGRLRNRVVAEV